MNDKTTLLVAGVQMDVAIGEHGQNRDRMEHYLRQAAGQGAKLIVFPECALSGYCFESLDEARPHAEGIPGPSTERLAAVCRELNVFAVVGLLEADGRRLFNAAALLGPAGVIGSYRKVHLPYLGIDMWTTPGDRPFAVWDTGPARVGMSICYDAAFPEASRVMALQGADVICLPTNWPPGAECTADFVINARALENHVYFVAANRVGTERGFTFIGRSKICDTAGRVLALAGDDQEQIIYAEIDPAIARRKHVIRVPGKHEIHRFADRRPELYGQIVEPVTIPSPWPGRHAVSAPTRRQRIEGLLADDPHDVFLRYGLALEHDKEGNHERGLLLLGELMRQQPPYVAAFFMSAQILERHDRVEEARDALRSGIETARMQGEQHAAGEMAEFLAQLGNR